MRGFLKRPERRGSASRGDPEQAAPGPERLGDTGVPRCPGGRGGRENWEWPLSESGGRWGDRGRPGSEVTGSGGKAPRTVRNHPLTPHPAKGSRRRRKGLRGGDLERTPPGRDRGALPPTAALGLESEPRTLEGKAEPQELGLETRVRVQRESGSSLEQNGMEVRGERVISLEGESSGDLEKLVPEWVSGLVEAGQASGYGEFNSGAGEGF